jgi:hypothetical protein
MIDNYRNVDESKYPMTYQEYEDKVIELFLKNDPSNKRSRLKFLDDLLKEDPDFIYARYKEDCYSYDHTKLDPPERIFWDYLLRSRPVHVLELLY